MRYIVELLIFFSVFALFSYSAEAQCAQWDVSGQWTIGQGPSGVPIDFDLTQVGTVINGRAEYALYRDGSFTTVSGIVEGTLLGDRFDVRITWGPNTTGVYSGKIGPQGKVEGETYDVRTPTKKVAWFSALNRRCISMQPTQAPSVTGPRTIRHTGKEVPPPAKAGNAQPIHRLKVTPMSTPPVGPPASAGEGIPSITASPNVVHPKAMQVVGETTLTWDGGKDHPYAEVWVKVDNQDETFVVEQGKGTRVMRVEPGRTYLYILTDAGVRLATVTVISR